MLVPARDGLGHRRYSAGDVRLARGIRAAQDAGLSLKQVRAFLTADAAGRAALLRDHRAGLLAEVARLAEARGRVEAALAAPVDPVCPYGL